MNQSNQFSCAHFTKMFIIKWWCYSLRWSFSTPVIVNNRHFVLFIRWCFVFGNGCNSNNQSLLCNLMVKIIVVFSSISMSINVWSFGSIKIFFISFLKSCCIFALEFKFKWAWIHTSVFGILASLFNGSKNW